MSRRRVALVTGASRGIGAAVAIELAARGRHVVLTARDEADLEEVAARAGHAGGTVAVIPADLSVADEATRLAKEAVERVGPVEILVSNAASIDPIGPLWDADDATWRRAFDVNVFGARRCLAHFLPGMVDRGWGRVVAVSSSSARQAFSGLSAYCSSKAAFEQLHAVASRECAGTGVVVNTVWPGAIDTAMQASLRDDRYPAANQARQAASRGLLRPAVEVAPLIADLCEDGERRNGELIDFEAT